MNNDKHLMMHNPNKLELYTLSSLRPLQGDFKKLTKANFEKMKNSFNEHGFSFPVKIWTDEKNINWVIGGHQRIKVLGTFQSCTVIDYINTDEGLEEIAQTDYDKIMIPCELVRATNRAEAVRLLLMEDSRFGTTNVSSNFFKDEGLGVDELNDFSIQDLDLPDLPDLDISDLDEQINDALIKLSENEKTPGEAPDVQANENYGQDMSEPTSREILSREAKMKHSIDIVSLTFTIPQKYAEDLENKLAEVPLIITGREKEQYLRGRRLIKLLLNIDMSPL